MNWSELLFGVEIWSYRVGSYLVLALADDPAWLALMFC